MPPPAPAAVNCSSSFKSAIRTSVVSISDTMEAAFCKAKRVTLAGSITPALIMSSNSPVSALKPKFSSFDQCALVAGVLCNLTDGFFKSTPYDIHAGGFIIVQFEFFQDWNAAQIS